jgi:hypothetical protein
MPSRKQPRIAKKTVNAPKEGRRGGNSMATVRKAAPARIEEVGRQFENSGE